MESIKKKMNILKEEKENALEKAEEVEQQKKKLEEELKEVRI